MVPCRHLFFLVALARYTYDSFVQRQVFESQPDGFTHAQPAVEQQQHQGQVAETAVHIGRSSQVDSGSAPAFAEEAGKDTQGYAPRYR